MSIEKVCFALNQKQLDPSEQLALIIICDAHSDYFLRADAINTVFCRTSLNERQVIKAVDALHAKGMTFEDNTVRDSHAPNEIPYRVKKLKS